MNILEDYRDKIDKIDETLLKLLAKRLMLASKVGVYKKKNKLPLVDEKREKEIIEKLNQNARSYNLRIKSVRKIWQIIFKESYIKEETNE